MWILPSRGYVICIKFYLLHLSDLLLVIAGALEGVDDFGAWWVSFLCVFLVFIITNLLLKINNCNNIHQKIIIIFYVKMTYHGLPFLKQMICSLIFMECITILIILHFFMIGTTRDSGLCIYLGRDYLWVWMMMIGLCFIRSFIQISLIVAGFKGFESQTADLF